MSVYIKGMEMPVDCLSCRVACDKENYGVIGRPPKCPLAEAPVGDLIGRAETIEAVELMEIFLGERKKNAVIRGIQTLPSAEAETVDCTDFIRWLTETVMDDGMWELNAVAYGEVIARKLTKLGVLEVKDDVYVYDPSAEAVQGWIPCSERLPKKEEETYWVCTDTKYQCECRWTNNRFGFGLCEGEWGWSIFDTPQYSKPIAWMPLPKPYRKESEVE